MAEKNDASIEDRVEKLEELVKRVLSLQQFDNLTTPSALIPSNWCTHSGTSNGCSTKSVGCDLSTKPAPTEGRATAG